ncbi:MAG: TonB-dependent receptor [Acidocella sp.]|nr:TonB-dependent receptor [Acidocella sp.]
MLVSKSLRLCLLTTTILSIPVLARADGTAPVMTVTATEVSTALADVPAGVTVITQAQMQARGDTTLVDALAAVPGLNVVQSGGPGGEASVFIRGTDSEDVLVLLDGVPVNDPSDPNGAFNFGNYTVSDIARIEVVRGPMSGLYGSNAVGGVINLITMQGSGKPKLSVTAAGGFPAQGQAGATLSGASGKFDYAFTAATDQEAGFDYTARRLSTYDGTRDPYRANLGSLNLGYSPVDGTRISLIFRAQQTTSASPDLGYVSVYDDPNNFLYNENYFGKLGITSNLLNGLLTTEFFVAQLQNDYVNKNLLDAADPNAQSNEDHYHGYRTDVQWNNTIHVPDYGPAQFSSLLFGVEYINDHATELVNDSGPFVASINASQHSIAGHAGVQTTLYNRLTLTGALRDDAVSSFGSAFTGRVGGVLAIPEADLHLKTSYGTSFLAPSLFDLYGVDSYSGFPYMGNPNLKPERGTGFEVGPQFDIPAFGQADFISISATYFADNISNLIQNVDIDNNTASTEANVGKARTSGVETELVFTPAAWLSADFTYTYTYARDLTDATPLLRRPENTGSATLTITPLPGLSIVPQVSYIGRFSDYLYNNDGTAYTGGNPYGVGLAEPGTIANLSVNYRLSPKLILFVDGKNLFQSHFEPVNGLQIPGQSFLFGVRATIQ